MREREGELGREGRKGEGAGVGRAYEECGRVGEGLSEWASAWRNTCGQSATQETTHASCEDLFMGVWE